MKATDLMVGDWVSYLGFYNKVIYIGQKVSMYDGKGAEFTTDPEHIRPIPLTEEILVKNGFKGNPLDGYYYWQDADRIELDGNFGYHGIVINYVHQLQRLLNLCNIDKEIIL